MKTVAVVALFALSLSPALASGPVMPSEAALYEGNAMTVQGHATLRQGPEPGLEIVLGDSHSPDGFVAIIPAENVRNFHQLSQLNGRTVDVTGVVEMDGGRPAITVSSPAQLSIVG